MHRPDAMVVRMERVESQQRREALEKAPTASHRIDPESEYRFWTKVSSGLTALAHFNCWAAADALVSLHQELLGPLLIVAHDASALTLRDAIERAALPLRGRQADARADGDTPTRGSLQWPLTFVEAHEWLIALVGAYQELIRTFWHVCHLDVDAMPNVLAQRCFALVSTCERLTHDMARPHLVLSWRSCSVVLPAYNEAENISDTVQHCITSLSPICPNFQIIVVDDGSRDATGAIADQWAAQDASVIVVHNRPNKGYGGALLAGFAAAQAERIFFMDSDGQFDAGQVAILLRLIESGNCQVAIGYRAKRSDPIMRKLNAWGWKLAARRVVGLAGITDIDCAFKLFPTDALRACNLIAQGASVNVEMLLKFQQMGLKIVQTPVKHLPRTKGSPTGAKPQVILRAFRELFRLRSHMSHWEPTSPLSKSI